MTSNRTLERNLSTARRQSYTDFGKNISVQRVNDLTMSTDIQAISAETISLSAGAAGTSGTTNTDKAPIYNANGTDIGHRGRAASVRGHCQKRSR